jgi:hypothetical protein
LLPFLSIHRIQSEACAPLPSHHHPNQTKNLFEIDYIDSKAFALSPFVALSPIPEPQGLGSARAWTGSTRPPPTTQSPPAMVALSAATDGPQSGKGKGPAG